ncbi:hypothetical protein M427DRAFT_52520 [Gonapodya prolifera JEL478]|uniref:Large ribosomal subunit protein mL45 n=1 Tax=Gonapodya prolifera (strain JEL478) TaxID=1344416 RepID=A0A139AUP1_GONPJ|nr:hypothetical protein M427DRAFT_52520 [Gonapodya prolifera JEL478]|eukprot:KXS20293.1 hypothetical protein M427DRAFT_52520 [Gonapodya prolifera JEL478]
MQSLPRLAVLQLHLSFPTSAHLRTRIPLVLLYNNYGPSLFAPHPSFPSAPLQFSRSYVVHGPVRAVIASEPIIFEPTPPKLSLASPSSVWAWIKRQARSVWSLREVRKAVPGFTNAQFLVEAESLYVKMNEAFASASLAVLHPIVTDGLLSQLSAEMKRRAPGSRMEWRDGGNWTRSRIEGAAVAQGIGGEKIAQITVRIRRRQTLLVRRSATNASTPDTRSADMDELVVFERRLNGTEGSLGTGGWRVAGKIESDQSK